MPALSSRSCRGMCVSCLVFQALKHFACHLQEMHLEKQNEIPFVKRLNVPNYPPLFTPDTAQQTTPQPTLTSRPLVRTKSVLDVGTDGLPPTQPRQDLTARGRKYTVGRTGKINKQHDPIPARQIPQLSLESELAQHAASTSSSQSSSSHASSGRGTTSITASTLSVKFSESAVVNKEASTANDKLVLANELPSRARKGKSLNNRFGLKKKGAKNRNFDERDSRDVSRESSPVYPRNRTSSINSHENSGDSVFRPGINLKVEATQLRVKNEIAAEPDPNKPKPGTDLEVAEYKHRVANAIAAGSDPNMSKSDTDNMIAAVNFAEDACKKYLEAALKVAGTLSALNYKRCAAQCMFAASSYSSRIAMGVLTDEIDQGLAYSRAQKYSDRSAHFNYQGYVLLEECKVELSELSRVPTKAADVHS